MQSLSLLQQTSRKLLVLIQFWCIPTIYTSVSAFKLFTLAEKYYTSSLAVLWLKIDNTRAILRATKFSSCNVALSAATMYFMWEGGSLRTNVRAQRKRERCESIEEIIRFSCFLNFLQIEFKIFRRSGVCQENWSVSAGLRQALRRNLTVTRPQLDSH